MTRSYSTAEGIRLRRIDEPEMRKLRRRLLQLGGKFVEPLVNLDGTFDRVSAGLLNREGFVFGLPAHIRPGVPGECHHNVARLWRRHRYRILGIGTGYALTISGTDAGWWREHSWGLARHSWLRGAQALLETTERRHIYFGILLQASAADEFAQRALDEDVYG
jgi:hypothetical protein